MAMIRLASGLSEDDTDAVGESAAEIGPANQTVLDLVLGTA
jgi:hypothetical protein